MTGLLAAPAVLVVLVPFAAAATLGVLPGMRLAAWVNLAASGLVFLLACLLPFSPGDAGLLLRVDPLAATMAILAAFIGFTAAWVSIGCIAAEQAAGRLDPPRVRLYHALFQTYLGAVLLALLADNLGVMWVAIEAATVAAVLVVGLSRTHAAIEAAWKFFILCGVGIALALFGTILLTLAAGSVLGPGFAAMSWTGLARAAPHLPGPLLNLAFVFVLFGYGTKAGLVPLHVWLPDSHAEGPTPFSAVLGALAPIVALVALLRLRAVLSANVAAGGGAMAPGGALMALGLLSVLLGTISLWRRGDVKRFFAFSSIEQSGVIAFAFGLGGRMAVFAGLLQLILHALAKAAVFQCVGRAAQLKGGQRFTDIGGLIAGHPALGWLLAGAIAAVAGLPPFGLFVSEFLILGEAVLRVPWLALLLGAGLILGALGLILRLQSLCFGPPTADRGPAPGGPALAAPAVHLVLVLLLGLALPMALGGWLYGIAGTFR